MKREKWYQSVVADDWGTQSGFIQDRNNVCCLECSWYMAVPYGTTNITDVGEVVLVIMGRFKELSNFKHGTLIGWTWSTVSGRSCKVTEWGQWLLLYVSPLCVNIIKTSKSSKFLQASMWAQKLCCRSFMHPRAAACKHHIIKSNGVRWSGVKYSTAGPWSSGNMPWFEPHRQSVGSSQGQSCR